MENSSLETSTSIDYKSAANLLTLGRYEKCRSESTLLYGIKAMASSKLV